MEFRQLRKRACARDVSIVNFPKAASIVLGGDMRKEVNLPRDLFPDFTRFRAIVFPEKTEQKMHVRRKERIGRRVVLLQ